MEKKKYLKELISGLLAERGVKAGIIGGLINGFFFLLIYLLAGVKELPIGILSFSVALLFIITHVIEAAVFGLVFSISYNFIPVEKGFYKSIILSLIFWFFLKLVPYFSLITTNPLLIVETVIRFLLMGILVYIIWDYFEESAPSGI
jgi:hypothetical protein